MQCTSIMPGAVTEGAHGSDSLLVARTDGLATPMGAVPTMLGTNAVPYAFVRARWEDLCLCAPLTVPYVDRRASPCQASIACALDSQTANHTGALVTVC